MSRIKIWGKEITLDDLKLVRENMMKPPEHPHRYVSFKEYKVLETLFRKNLLTANFIPKNQEAWDLFFELIRETKS